MIENKTIFITGGAGFIANILISKLIDKNKTIAFDNFHRDTISNSSIVHHPNLKIIRGDVLNYKEVYSAMKGADIVVHVQM